MDFVLSSLERIGFINGIEGENPQLKENFGKIVVSSVGKNPRSIKRLINTLSLLNCIRKCKPVKDKFSETIEAKTILFAIVSIQVCYPKIYRMLTIQPEFTAWDIGMIEKLNIRIGKNKELSDWNDVLNTLCDHDIYLAQHRNDLHQLLVLLKDTAEIKNPEDYSEVLKNPLFLISNRHQLWNWGRIFRSLLSDLHCQSPLKEAYELLENTFDQLCKDCYLLSYAEDQKNFPQSLMVGRIPSQAPFSTIFFIRFLSRKHLILNNPLL